MLALMVWVGAAQAATVTWKLDSIDQGAAWTYLDGNTRKITDIAAEFNVSFPNGFEGVTSSFAYCVDLAKTVTVGQTYKNYSVATLDGGYLWAAWLIEKYIPNPSGGVNLTGATNSVLISALQAAIWSVTGQNKYNPISSLDSGRQAVYTKYSEIMSEYNSAFNNIDVGSLGLQNAYKLLVSDKNQNIIVRTSAVPVPAAVWMLGSGLLAVVVMRRKRQV